MSSLWFETPTTAQFLPDTAPLIAATDRGFTYGDGLFETIRVLDSTPLFLDRHLNRLTAGLTVLNLSTPWDAASLTERCHRLITNNQISYGLLRLTITRGPGPRGYASPDEPSPALIIQTFSTPPDTPRSTLHATLAPWRIDPANLIHHLKSLSALDRVLAKQYAHQHQADEALFLNLNDHLTEATSANLFIVTGNQILTPSLSCGVLPGITRQLLIETAPTLGYRIIETEVTLVRLTQATEAFVTNTAIGLQSLTHFNQQPIGSGQPGPITQALTDHYTQLCQSQISNPPIL